jgi:biotin transporter BioY
MKMGRKGYLIGFVLAAILAVANARHLTDPSLGWVLRYGSIAWALMAVINLLNLIDAVNTNRRGPDRNVR